MFLSLAGINDNQRFIFDSSIFNFIKEVTIDCQKEIKNYGGKASIHYQFCVLIHFVGTLQIMLDKSHTSKMKWLTTKLIIRELHNPA